MRYLFLLMIFWIGTLSVLADEPLTPQNADQIVQLQMIGRGINQDLVASPDGRTIALGSSVGIWLYDGLDLFAEPRLLPTWTGSVSNLVWDDTGSRLLGVLSDESMRVWDVATGVEQVVLIGQRAMIYGARFSPDGNYIVSSAVTDAVIWDAHTGEMLHRLVVEGQERAVLDAVFSPDSQQVLTGHGDTIARVWDVPTGEQLLTFDGDLYPLWRVYYSPDGSSILTDTHVHDIVNRWDVATGELQETLMGDDALIEVVYSHTKGVDIGGMASETMLSSLRSMNDIQDIVLNRDQTRLITYSLENDILLWDLVTGDLLQTFEGHLTRPSIAYSHDESQIISSAYDRMVRVWDVASGESMILNNFSVEADHIVYNPDQTLAITLAGRGAYVEIWDLSAGERVQTLDIDIWWVAWAEFTADSEQVITVSRWGKPILWDVATGEPLMLFDDGENWQPYFIRLSADKQTLFVSGRDGKIRMWDVATGAKIHEIALDVGDVDFALSLDERLMIVSTDALTDVQIWDVETLTQVYSIPKDGQRLFKVESHPNGKDIWLYLTDDILILDTQSWEWEASSLFNRGTRQAFDTTSERVAFINQDMLIWNPETDQMLVMEDYPQRTHLSAISRLMFSPDGALLLAIHRQGTYEPYSIIEIWDAGTGEHLHSLKGHTSYINQLAFNADGSQIITASSDSTIRIWGIAE